MKYLGYTFIFMCLSLVLTVPVAVYISSQGIKEEREAVTYNVYLEDGKKITLDKVIIDKCYIILEYPDGHVVWLSMKQVKSVVKRRK